MSVYQTYPVVKPAVHLDCGTTMQNTEKNWSPFKFEGNRVLLSRFASPHEVGLGKGGRPRSISISFQKLFSPDSFV